MISCQVVDSASIIIATNERPHNIAIHVMPASIVQHRFVYLNAQLSICSHSD